VCLSDGILIQALNLLLLVLDLKSVTTVSAISRGVCCGVSSEGGEQYVTLVDLISNALNIIIFLTFHHYGPEFASLLFCFLLCSCLLVTEILNSSAITNPMELSPS
jgi:hypothetical protein